MTLSDVKRTNGNNDERALEKVVDDVIIANGGRTEENVSSVSLMTYYINSIRAVSTPIPAEREVYLSRQMEQTRERLVSLCYQALPEKVSVFLYELDQQREAQKLKIEDILIHPELSGKRRTQETYHSTVQKLKRMKYRKGHGKQHEVEHGLGLLEQLRLNHDKVYDLLSMVKGKSVHGDKYLSELQQEEQKYYQLREKFVQVNLRLVINQAKRYQNKGLSLIDLVQEGNIGLLRAVEKFDYRMGGRFSTYGTWWIRQSIQRAIAEKGQTIQIPIHQQEHHKRLMRTQRELSYKLGRPVTVEEVAKKMGYSVHHVQEMMEERTLQPTSLQETLPGWEDFSAEDFLEDHNVVRPENVIAGKEREVVVRKVLGTLPPRDEQVLRARFGFDGGKEYMLDEVAEIHGVSRERVRQIEAEALKKLRHLSRAKKLRMVW